jgi:hypothetical protein
MYIKINLENFRLDFKKELNKIINFLGKKKIKNTSKLIVSQKI